jgi:ankyrin repeat protein
VKKGCSLIFALWMVLVAAYGYVAWHRIPEPFPAALIAVLGGTFAWVLVASFIGFFTGGRDRAALRRAVNAEPLRDGRLEAANGPIRPLGAALEAPFTGRPCVVYQYDVKQPGAGHSEFAGYALTPSAISTVRGSVRVLGWPILDKFPQEDATIDRARGLAYLQSATFESLGPTRILSVVSELLADDDGTVRKDLRIGDATLDLAGRTITERIVPVGAPITMLGRWSDLKQGFTPAGPSSLNRIFAGDLEQTKQEIRGNTLQVFGAGVFFFVALHAILVPIYLFAPTRNASGTTGPPSVWDERDCDRQKVLLAEGANPNELGRDGLTPLMNAARMTEPACVQNLIAAGARLETADKFGDSALAQAITGGRDDNAEMLRKAGAKDFRVTEATGESVTDGSAPFAAVKEYIAAVHRGDFNTMARLKIGASVQLMEERRDDLAFWQSMRPRSPEIADGWMNDKAATLTVRGSTPGGDRRIWYHLENGLAGWRIKREWFPD